MASAIVGEFDLAVEAAGLNPRAERIDHRAVGLVPDVLGRREAAVGTIE